MAKKFLSDIELDAGLVDVNGNTGTSGQVLSSTGSATSWISQGDIVAAEADKAKSVTLRVKNSTNSAMTKGQVICEAVSATPPNGNLIEVALADNNAASRMPALGILNEDLDASGGSNDEGDAIMFGKVSGINTSAFSVGDEVFVSDTPGGLTSTKPTGVKYIQKVGVVIRDDSTNGTIEVFGAGRVNDVPTPLYIDHANQRLGIREPSPSSELHISKDSEGPELRLSHIPSGGFGGGGNIIIEGGANDYVYGSINFENGGNRDAQIVYGAFNRTMSFRVNERDISTNGYFRFYDVATKVAEISPSGIYGNVFYDLSNTAYYLDPASTGTALNAPLGSARVKNVFIENISGQVSNRIWFDNGSVYQPGLYFDGSHPKFIINTQIQSIFHDGYHPNADTWTTARTITLGGDLTGSVSIDGSSNVTLSAQVNNNSHQHNILYENSTITYGASQLQWMDITGNGGTGLNGSNPQNPANAWHHHILMNHANNNGYYVDLAFDFHDDNVWFQRNENGTLQGWQQMFHDSYHPNADTWTTARTITIGNTGKSVNGSANVAWSLSEIGAAASSHNHDGDYVELTGDTMSGPLIIDESDTTDKWLFRVDNNGSNLSGFWSASQDIHLYLRDDAGNTRVQLRPDARSLFYDGLQAANLYDSDNTSYYVDPASTTASATFAGNVGIGTTSLTTISSTSTTLSLGSTSATTSGGIAFQANGVVKAYNYVTNNYLINQTVSGIGQIFYGAGSERMRIHNTTGNVGIGTTSPGARLHVSSGTANEDCVVIIESDTDNNDETSNPRLELRQDAGGVIGRLGYRDNTNSLELINQYAESLYLGTSNTTDLTILSGGNVGIGTTSPSTVLEVSSTGVNGVDISQSASNASQSGRLFFTTNTASEGFALFNANGTFQMNSGGIPNDTSGTNRISIIGSSGNVGIGTTGPGHKLSVNGTVSGTVFYDYNNTGYFFNGDASKDGVDLVTSSNYAINVLGTIAGGHRKHGNLETPEMQWSVGGSTDLNWKKLCDVVVSDASYSGWGAEIEITNFSGNYGNATYSSGELYKGALSVYHWGGTGNTTETAYANIPYDMRSFVRWYKIQESGKNRYQLQVKSPGNYQQIYVKVKPGLGNQVADIITYSNGTNGATSGGTAYVPTVANNFNHEFAGGIWTNDARSIGWRNAYGSPYLSSYYGTITTSTGLYVGGPTGNGQDVFCDDLRSNKVFDRGATSYYFEGGNTGDSIRVAGDVVAYYSSDKRLKDNINPIENALDKVKAISGVTFEWNEKSHKTTGKKDVGVVAQEIEAVLPELVETRTNGYKAVDYQKLTAVLIESVKELTAKVEALESKQCNCK